MHVNQGAENCRDGNFSWSRFPSRQTLKNYSTKRFMLCQSKDRMLITQKRVQGD